MVPDVCMPQAGTPPPRSHDPSRPVKWATLPPKPSKDFSLFSLFSSFPPRFALSLACVHLALDRCQPPSSLDSSPMPTPSNNHPTSITEVIPTRTCPPDLDRISAWRDSPDSTGSPSDVLGDHDIPSPPGGTAPSVLSRTDDGSVLLAPETLKVEQKLAAGTDLDIGRDRSVSPTDTCDRGRSSPVMPTPSLMRYEFSNVRVRNTPISAATRHSINQRDSFCQITPRRFFALEADSQGLRCRTNKFITLTWRLSM